MPFNDTINTIKEGLVDSIINTKPVLSEPTVIIIKDTIVNYDAIDNSAAEAVVGSTIDLNISALLTIAFLGLGIGLYFLLAFLKKYILPVFIQRYQKHNVHLFWYRFKVLIWLAFSLLSLYVFLKSSVLITCIILVFTGLVFHHFIVDFILGVYFQIENHIKVKDRFILNDIEGEVKGFYGRHLKVLTIKNEETFIPYRNLLKSPIRIVKQVDSLIQKHFEVKMPGESSNNLIVLQKYMTMCPWIYDPKLFKIEYKSEDCYQISVRVKEEFTANKIESFIQSKLK